MLNFGASKPRVRGGPGPPGPPLDPHLKWGGSNYFNHFARKLHEIEKKLNRVGGGSLPSWIRQCLPGKVMYLKSKSSFQ